MPKFCQNAIKKTAISRNFAVWCGKEDLNPHSLEPDPKSGASANSAISARCLVAHRRLELRTPRLKVLCSTN